MAALVDKANLDAANRAFDTAVNTVFGRGAPGFWQMFTRLQNVSNATNVDQIVVDGAPAIREWVGSRQHSGLRVYKKNFVERKWEATIEIPMSEIRGDRTGAVGQRLTEFVQRQSTVFDKIVTDELLSNPTGYDGVALLNGSHPNVSGTTDNLGATGLSFAELRNAQQALAEMKDEAGEPLDLTVTHLMVGPKLARKAMEITGAERPVPVDGTGSLDGNTSVAAAPKLMNFDGDGINVIVNPRITGSSYNDSYFFMDLSKGDVKPMVLFEFEAPRADIFADPKDPSVFNYDEAVYGITAKATPAPANWQTVYGFVGGS